MDKALNGDMECAKLVLPFLPKPKLYTAPIKVDLPKNATPEDCANALTKSIFNGEVDPMVACNIINAMFNATRFIDIHDIMEMLGKEVEEVQRLKSESPRSH
ncbi:hypothetical protein [Thalassotalea aquiviva]|uniref:hypothetical protein n=1 Tax=Thalassotalea aquiviva TaxID=3242415 RepID=UPI00352BC2CF